MRPIENGETATAQALATLPGVAGALVNWRIDPGPTTADDLGGKVALLASDMQLQLGRLHVSAPPLPDLDLHLGDGTRGAEIVLREPIDPTPIGSIRVSGPADAAARLGHLLEIVFGAARAQAIADRTVQQLGALDEAVRGIGGVLELDRVLQLITDKVRVLAPAEYAALGIVDAEGTIEAFITSGITDEARQRIGDLPRGHGLLGLIIRENRTYRIPDIGAHPARHGFPPDHPAMHSFLGMPIMAQGEVVGRLYLTNKVGATQFSDADQALVEMFARHAGIAIENARLHAQLGRLALVDERDRISRDLHDSVIQAIYAQTLMLDDVPELMTEDAAEAARRVDDAIDALHAVIRDIRNFIFGLRPVLLEVGSLTDGLRELAGELRRGSAVEATVSVDDRTGELEDLPIDTVVELLSVAREALSNIARHASATNADIELVNETDMLRLTVTDDGDGFSTDGPMDHTHHGLANMRARTHALGGSFEVNSSPRSGTRVIIGIPHEATHGGAPK